MALFSSDSEQKQKQSTIVSEGSSILGELQLTCSLFFDGKLEGSIDSSDEVSIGKNAYIQGKIVARSVIVFGAFVGEIDADLVEIKEGGSVKGKVVTSEFIIEPKAIFEGESYHKDEDMSEDDA